MAKPPYIAIKLLNPVESAIQNIEETPKAAEESLIAITSSGKSSNDPGVLIPKQRFAILLWFTINLSVLHSWFSFTLVVPRFQHYYRKSFLTISSMFWSFPLVLSLVIPILSKFLEKDTSYLIPLAIAAFLNALGCAVKCTGTNTTGFSHLVVGHFIIMVAFPLSHGFPILYSKQYPKRNRLISSLGTAATALGSISGMIMLPLLLEEKENSIDIELSIYKYYIWSAVSAAILLALIPFSMKERKQCPTTAYQSFNAISPVDDVQSQNESSSSYSSYKFIRGILKVYRSAWKEKKLFIKVCASGVSFGTFLNLFVASVVCLYSEPKRTWTICIVESFVILTFILYILMDLRLKLNISKLVVVLNNLLLLIATLSFAFSTKTEMLSLHLFLFYFLHSSFGFNCFVSARNTLTPSNCAKISLVMIFCQGFLASMTCFLLSYLLWGLSTVTWAISICLLGLLSIFCSFFPQ